MLGLATEMLNPALHVFLEKAFMIILSVPCLSRENRLAFRLWLFQFSGCVVDEGEGSVKLGRITAEGGGFV